MVSARSFSRLSIAAVMFALSAANSASADDVSDMADWCAKVTAPSNVVVCSDPELRRMAVVRNKIFEDARANFSDDDMKEMNAEQRNWVRRYTAACGASVDGPPIRYPISPNMIECFKREGRGRIAELVAEMREDFPNYPEPSVSGSLTYTYQDVQRATEAQRAAEQRAADAQRIIDARKLAEQKEAEAQRAIEQAAEETRRQIQAQAAHDRLVARLKELGFELIGPVDLNLDWKNYMAGVTNIAINGTYVQDDDVEVLSTPDNKDQPHIRLYTDNASRDARKLMLECRNSSFKLSSCQMVLGGTINSCIRNQGKLNEKQVPCLRVQEAFVKG